MTLVVNLYGGPGSGKSTTATGVFSLLKMHDVNCEYVSEYAKDRAWEKSLTVCYNQFYIGAKQYHRQFRLDKKVDVMITDSPMLQQLVYTDDPFFKVFCINMNDRFKPSLHYFMNRTKKFNPKGRKHSLKQSLSIDRKIKRVLTEQKLKYDCIDGNYHAPNLILFDVLSILNKEMKFAIGNL